MLDSENLADVPFAIARILMTIAAVCFAAYILFIISAVLLTWRPAGAKKKAFRAIAASGVAARPSARPGGDEAFYAEPESGPGSGSAGAAVEAPTGAGTRGRHRLSPAPAVRDAGEGRIEGAA